MRMNFFRQVPWNKSSLNIWDPYSMHKRVYVGNGLEFDLDLTGPMILKCKVRVEFIPCYLRTKVAFS